MIDFELERLRHEVEAQEHWKDWLRKMPALRFDSDWDVRVIPPFAGALARFWIDKGDKHVSVYFDTLSRLGWMMDGEEPIPYFELYPFEDDVKRYHLDETDELMRDIRAVLNA